MLFVLPFLLFVGIILPWLAWSSWRKLSSIDNTPDSLPSADALAIETIGLQLFVFGLAWIAMINREISIPWSVELGWKPLLLACVILAGGLTFAWIEGRRPLGARDSLRKKLRSISPFKVSTLAVMVVAAVSEEFAFRCVLPALLMEWFGDYVAWFLSAVLFGLAHSSQGWRGAVASFAFGLLLQILVHASGGLILAILVHFSYDLIVGWLGWRLAQREGDALTES